MCKIGFLYPFTLCLRILYTGFSILTMGCGKKIYFAQSLSDFAAFLADEYRMGTGPACPAWPIETIS